MYTVRRIGTAANTIHNKNFSINRPHGYDCYLLLFVKTRAVFTFGDTQTICKPNSFILYNIGTPHQYKALDDTYINDWLHLESDEIPPIPLDTLIHIGSTVDISGYIELIADAFYRRNIRACSLMLRAILSEVSSIADNLAYRSAYTSNLINLRKSVYSNPGRNWSIRSMSQELHVSESYLQELYKGAFGVTCGADVINARIEAAKMLILDTDISITDISEKCGYESHIHFSRQFRKVTGYSPSCYRKLYRK